MVGGLEDVLKKTDTRREIILYLNNFKHLLKVILNLVNQFECDICFKENE